MKNILKGVFIFILTAFLTVVLPFLSNYIVSHLYPYFHNKEFVRELVLPILFYIIQVGFSGFIVIILMRKSPSTMGLNLNNLKTTFKILKWFLSIWLILDILFYSICLTFYPGFDTYIANYYVADTKNLIHDFIVGCMFAGIGEEPLFRGLVVILLLSAFSKDKQIGNIKLGLIAVCSGIFFMMAHVAYDISPFRIIIIDYIQLTITFILGTFWAMFFIKTKSLLGPIIAHTCANIIQIMSGYIVAFWILN